VKYHGKKIRIKTYMYDKQWRVFKSGTVRCPLAGCYRFKFRSKAHKMPQTVGTSPPNTTP